MKVLITGATGFIGKHLIDRLFNDGHEIFITLLPHENNPFDITETTGFVLDGDYMQNLKTFMSENTIDGIIHLASFVQSGDHNSEEVPRLIDTNVKFSVLILESAVYAKVKWFINTGTYWQHYNNKDYSPVNLYAATKQAFMDIARFYWETEKINFCTIKLFDTYGPNDTRPKIFNLWDGIARSGETLDMSSGEQLIDISHVDDIISAFELLAKHLQNQHPDVKNGDVFAVKANKRYTLKQLATIYEVASNTKLNINWGARQYRDREVMIPWIDGVIVPGWKPKFDIEAGIKIFLGIQ